MPNSIAAVLFNAPAAGVYTIRVRATSGSGEYILKANDPAALTVTIAADSISEGAGAAATTATVTRNSGTTGNLVVTLTSDDTSEATVPTTVTILDGQTSAIFNIDAVNDALIDGPQVVTITASGAGHTDDDDTLTVTDDEPATLTLEIVAASIAETAGPAATTATVTRNRDLAGALTVNLISNDTSEATVPNQVIIPAGQTSVTFNIDAQDDDVDDQTQSVTISATASGFTGGNDTVDVTDNDVSGFVITETDGSTSVDESGTTDTFTVVLTSEPLGDVELDVTSGDPGEAIVGPTTLTFDATNWDTPQTVTVTGVDDVAVDGPQTTTITLAIDAGNTDDALYDAVGSQTVSATTTDDDVAAFTITETDGGTSVDESGTTDTFTVVLDAQPLTDVVLTVVSGNTGEATVDNAMLTFTMANWDTPQTVTVTGEDDVTVDGPQTTIITLAIDDAASNDAFDNVANQTVSVTTTDDDIAAFSITETDSNTTVDESGTTDTFAVVLDARPLTDVTLTVISANTDEVTVGSGSLIFTPTNWNTPQTVTVTGVDDVTVDGPQTTIITLAIDDAASNDAFDPVADQTVSVTTTDDDVAGFTIVESDGGTSVDESGTADTFSVVLDRQPLSDVTLTVVSADTDEATVDNATLTFTMANWNAPQTVTVTGVNDDVDDGDQTTLVTVSIDDTASNDAFDNIADQTVSVTTVDDDAVGFVITETDGSTSVDESGTTDTFTVVLTSEPLGDVELDVTSGDPGEAIVGPTTLTFTPANWNAPQTVIAAGADDAIVDGTQISSITVAIDDDNSNDAFDPIADQTITVTTADNEVPGFSTSESGGSTIVSESGGTDTFDVVLNFEPLSDVVIDVSSGDTGEATTDQSKLTFTTSNWDTPQIVTVAGADDVTVDGSQIAAITLSIDEAGSDDLYDAVGSQTVTVTNNDDDVAAFTVTESGANTVLNETGTTDSITVVLDRQPLSDVVFNVASDDTTEASVVQGALTFTPANWDSPQTVSLAGVDDVTVDGDQDSNITVSVVQASSDDAFDNVAAQTVSVTTTDDDVAGFSITQSDGSTQVSETGSTDSFDLALTRQPLSTVVLTIALSEQSEVSLNRTFAIFTPANWNVAQTIIVTGKDDPIIDGQQSTLLTVSVDAATSDAAFDDLADQTFTATTADNDVTTISFDASGNLQIIDNSPLGLANSLTVSLVDGILSIIDPSNVLQTSAGTQISDHEVQVSSASITTGRIIADLKSGNDSLDASGVTSSLSLDARGGSGNDTITGTAQTDSIDGGSGNDVLMAGSGDDDVDGGAGDDSVDGGAGDDDLTGGGGVDTLLVQTDSRLFLTESLALGADVDAHREFEQGIVSGSDDNNRLDARFANIPVTLLGLRGNDTLLGGSRGDLLDGGDGIDMAEVSGSNITLTNSNAPGMDIDSVVSVEGLHLIATDFGSTIDASAYTLGPVTIIGSAGNDILKGGSGNDLIFAGAGSDNVSGGAGNDLIFAGIGADVVSGGDGDDLISGGKGNDNLSGDSGNDAIFGGFGKDLIDGGSGADDLFGGGNADTIRGGDGDDFLFGSHGRDLLDGQAGGDALFGGNSRDTLFGGSGIDFLNGVLRDDNFNGQVGQDLLNGGTAPQNRPASVVAKQIPETAESAEPPASSASDQSEIDDLFSDPLSLDLSLI